MAGFSYRYGFWLLVPAVVVLSAGHIWRYSAISTDFSATTSVPSPPQTPTDVIEPVSLEQTALLWLQRSNYGLAIAAMDRLAQESPWQAAQLELLWVQHLTGSIEDGRFDYVHASLDALLEAFPYHENYLLTRAQALVAQGLTGDAAMAFYELAEVASGDQALIYQSSARELATSHLAALIDTEQWPDGLTFADQVVWQEPNYGPYWVGKIELYLALGDRQQALIQLERLSYLPGFETQVQAFNDQLQVASNALVGPRTVNLQRVNNHWLVPVTVDGQDQLALIIDTGASLTVVSESTFAQMGAGSAYLRSVTMNTAGGPTSAEVYRVQRFQLGGFQLSGVEFAVMPLTGLQGDGLLGMNVLQQFAFNIDTSANTLTLAQP